MIYFDTAYVVKCYLREPGTPAVRRLTESGEAIASCDLVRAEFAAAVHRHRRERRITEREAAHVLRKFREDARAGYWTLLPLTSDLLSDCVETFLSLPPEVPLRTADALHLLCARNNGFQAIYSNDAHMKKAAPHLGLQALDILA